MNSDSASKNRIHKLKVDKILEIALGNSFLTSGVIILGQFESAISGIYSTLAREFDPAVS